MLTIRLPILSKNIIHYDVRWASRPVDLLLSLRLLRDSGAQYFELQCIYIYIPINDMEMTYLNLWITVIKSLHISVIIYMFNNFSVYEYNLNYTIIPMIFVYHYPVIW